MIKLLLLLPQLFKSQFSKNVIKLSTWTALSQAIPFIFYPLIAHLYLPETFSFYGKYLLLIGLLGIGCSGKLELATVPEQNEKNRLKIFKLSIFITFTATTLIALCFYTLPLKNILINYNLHKYLNILTLRLFVIPGMFLFSLNHIQTYFFTSWGKFNLISKQRLIQSTLTALSMTIFGLLGHTGAKHLIYSSLLSLLITNIICWNWSYKISRTISPNNDEKSYLELLKYYSNFPIFSTPMAIINYCSTHILSFFIMLFNIPHLLGYLLQAEKFIKTPLNILNNSLSHVFYQKISNYNNQQKEIKLYLIASFTILTINSVLLFPVALFSEEIFLFILGDKWLITGKLVTLLIPLYCLTSAISAVSNVYGKFRMNHISLIWQILYFTLIGTFLLLYGKTILNNNFNNFFYIYSLFSGIMFIFFWLGGYIIIKTKADK